jgi:hypothetical protein
MRRGGEFYIAFEGRLGIQHTVTLREKQAAVQQQQHYFHPQQLLLAFDEALLGGLHHNLKISYLGIPEGLHVNIAIKYLSASKEAVLAISA